MKYILYIITFTLISSMQSYAQDRFEFERKDNKILIYASSCEQIKAELPALSKWTKSSGKTCDPKKVVLRSGNKCSADITSCVPEHVVKFHGTNPKISGPNCFNLALVTAGLIPHLRQSTDEEMTGFMQAPLCRPLSSDESKEPGDIGAIRVGNGGEFHGFIHVSDNIIYNKRGIDKEYPYSLINTSETFRDNKMSEADRKCTEATGTCVKYTKYFRCKSMDDYLKENLATINVKTMKAKQIVDKIECGLENYLIEPMTNYDQSFGLSVDVSKILLVMLNKEIKDIYSKSKEDQMIIGLLKLRLTGVLKTINSNISDDSGNDQQQADLVVLKKMMNKSIKKIENMEMELKIWKKMEK